MITRRHLIAALPIAILTPACTSTPDPEPTPLPTPSAGPGGTTAASDAGGEDEHHHTYPEAPTDEADNDAAAAHATATLRAFWATDKTQDQWYTDLAALMTPEGGEPFAYTRIENILPGELTGDATVTFLDEGNTAEVTLPSDQGDWTLTLYRTQTGWLTESIRFPEEG